MSDYVLTKRASDPDSTSSAHVGPIAALSVHLQDRQELPLWLLDDSQLIQQIARKRPPSPGRRTRILVRVFSLLRASSLAWATIGVIGTVLTVHGWLRSRRERMSQAHAENILLGMGAGQEQELLAHLAEGTGTPVAHLDERDIATLGRVGAPRLGPAVGKVWRTASLVVERIRRSDDVHIRQYAPYWLARLAILVNRYSIGWSWARYLPDSTARIVFLAPSPVTFAAVDALKRSRIRIEWWQHGSIVHSSMYPAVDRVYALTRPEASYLGRRCISSTVELYFPKGRPTMISAPTSRVLFLSQYDNDSFRKADQLATLEAVFAWLRERGHEIVVRPHPRESGSFWSTHFPEVAVQRSPARFLEHLAELRPRLVLSWFSTALVDAVLAGVPGVCLDTVDPTVLDDVVLDFRRIFPVWGRDTQTLHGCLASEPALAACLERQVINLFGRL